MYTHKSKPTVAPPYIFLMFLSNLSPFLLICGFSFHSPNRVFHRAKVCDFNKVQLIKRTTYFFCMAHAFNVSEHSSANSGSPVFSCVILYRSFTVLHFTLSSVMYFELIFVKDIRPVSRLIFCI